MENLQDVFTGLSFSKKLQHESENYFRIRTVAHAIAKTINEKLKKYARWRTEQAIV